MTRTTLAAELIAAAALQLGLGRLLAAAAVNAEERELRELSRPGRIRARRR